MSHRAPLSFGLTVLFLSSRSGLAQPPPPSPSIDDLNGLHARMFELTLAGFRLPASLAAPPVEPGGGLDLADRGAALHSCMEETDYPDFGSTWRGIRSCLTRTGCLSAADRDRVIALCGPDRPPLSQGVSP